MKNIELVKNIQAIKSVISGDIFCSDNFSRCVSLQLAVSYGAISKIVV